MGLDVERVEVLVPWCLEMGTVESLVLGGGYGKGERRPRSWFLGFGMGRTEVLVLHDRRGEGGLALGSLTDGSPAGTTQGDAPGGGTHPTWEKGTLEIPSKEGDDLQTPIPTSPSAPQRGQPSAPYLAGRSPARRCTCWHCSSGCRNAPSRRTGSSPAGDPRSSLCAG